MAVDGKYRVCPMERAGQLDSRLRRWLQNPQKILTPYIDQGMTVLDFGCGPGFFTIDMAKMVGKEGKVIASDLQNGMLKKLQEKIDGYGETGIELHQCSEDKIGLNQEIDFIFAFYVVHEVGDQKKFFDEVKSLLKPGGKIFIVEPPIHVRRSAFKKMIALAENTGFSIVERPKVFLGQTVVFEKND